MVGLKIGAVDVLDGAERATTTLVHDAVAKLRSQLVRVELGVPLALPILVAREVAIPLARVALDTALCGTGRALEMHVLCGNWSGDTGKCLSRRR